jgi:periplasmic protein TonB
MFDSVLRPGQLPKRRFGTGTVLGVLVQLIVLAAGIQLSAAQREKKLKEAEVTFVARAPAPPPPPPAAAPKTVRPKIKPQVHKTVLQQAIVAPTVIPEEKPPEQEPTNEAPADDGEEGGEVGGVAGGIQGGVLDAADVGKPPPPPPPRIQLDESVVKLKKIAGPEIQYTDQALEHDVQGLMIVRCIVATDGTVRSCQVLKSLPFMDRAVIGSLEHWRYQPYAPNGTPVEVDYTFKIRLTLPQ